MASFIAVKIERCYNKKWNMYHFIAKPETAGAEVSVDQGFDFLCWQQAHTLLPFEQECDYMQERSHFLCI